MVSWATRQKFKISTTLVVILVVFSALYYALFIREPASCIDKKMNQDEKGVDCGGVCPLLCEAYVNDLITEYTRSLDRGEGRYDAISFIENPNITGGFQELVYTFKLYDKDNILITEKTGKTFVNAREKFIIYEPNIFVGERVPSRVFFDFEQRSPWTTISSETPQLTISNKDFELLPDNSRLKAVISNGSFFDVRDIVITAILSDKDNNVVSVSSTQVDFLPSDSKKDISFIFPHTLTEVPAKIEILPRTKQVGNK